MKYIPEHNEVLEALCYLGSRANGYTAARLEARLRSKGVADLTAFRARYAPFGRIFDSLDSTVALPREPLRRLFTDLAGFPYNTTGAFSPAVLLFFPSLGGYRGDLEELLERMRSLSPGHVAQHLLISLDATDRLTPDVSDHSSDFVDTVLSMNIPAESRLALLELHRNFAQTVDEVGDLIRPVLRVLRTHREELERLNAGFAREVTEAGCETYLRQTSHLRIKKGSVYYLRPLLLGPDSNLSLDYPQEDGSYVIYCGVLRPFLYRLLTTSEGAAAQVFEAFMLLGDRTRFDILRFLRDRPAYGQELSEQFGLARNTIHHHMSKLVNAGLVTCTVSGNRIYYCVDKARFELLLQQQRELLIGSPASAPDPILPPKGTESI